MTERKTRREVLKGGLALAAAAALPASARPAQSGEPDTEAVEKQLAQPLSGEARKLLAGALKANREAAAERLKTPCPENSEPAFAFSPRPKEKRSW